MKRLDEETFQKYKKLGRGAWGKDLSLWKMMYTGMLNLVKEEDFTPFVEMSFNMFLDLPKARKEGRPIIMYPFNYGPEIFFAINLSHLMQEVISVGLDPLHLN